jgi:hypothetical protein
MIDKNLDAIIEFAPIEVGAGLRRGLLSLLNGSVRQTFQWTSEDVINADETS